MAAVDALSASRAHKNVLVVIGHANNFVGHDLADRENEIETAMRNQSVHLCRPRIVELAFRLLVDEFGWNLAEGRDVGAPVMHPEKLYRHGAKHPRDLLGLHGSVCAESRQNRLEPVAEILPGVAREVASAGMHAALIRWHDENPVPFPKLRQTLHQQI